MKRCVVAISMCAALAAVLVHRVQASRDVTPNMAVAGQFSPSTSAPSETDVPNDGRCVKGRFECRWGGSCVKEGSKCLSCVDGYSYQQGLGCYKCPEGYALRKTEGGSWECSK
jgi:hypothetical protein